MLLKENIQIKRTGSNDAGFQKLITHLDHELWNELNEDQITYDQYNKVSDNKTAVVLYLNGIPAASGCFRKYNNETVEIKRMYVEKEYRGKGLSHIVLKELEDWAIESGFQYAILETSVHFKAARSLYTNAGYKIIDNYDQYAGLEESVCMKKELRTHPLKQRNGEQNNKGHDVTSFKILKGIEYFDFEEDFIEENVRCIPMIVRFKMDKAGIKLKLSEWSKFSIDEKKWLALQSFATYTEIKIYNSFLKQLVKKYTNKEVTEMDIEKNPAWDDKDRVPEMLNEKAKEFNWRVSNEQWKELTQLQRFALLKLCESGHENRNFPKAMKEFGLSPHPRQKSGSNEDSLNQ